MTDNTDNQNKELRVTFRVPEFLRKRVETQDDKTHYIVNAIVFYEQYKNHFKDTEEDVDKNIIIMKGWHFFLVKCPKCGHKQKYATKSKYLIEQTLTGIKYHRKRCEKCSHNFIVHKSPFNTTIVKKLF